VVLTLVKPQHVHNAIWSDGVVGGKELDLNTRRRRQEMNKKIRSDNFSIRSHHRREVIKGTATNSISEYPYNVSLLNRNSRNKIWHVCGGVLIAPNIGTF